MQMQGTEAVWKLVLDAHLHCVYPGRIAIRSLRYAPGTHSDSLLALRARYIYSVPPLTQPHDPHTPCSHLSISLSSHTLTQSSYLLLALAAIGSYRIPTYVYDTCLLDSMLNHVWHMI